jgi:MoaA/NifB/PqqE/SkfB family radical SAM enzyme
LTSSTHVQTSPYLSFTRPNKPFNLVYMSDTRGPEVPAADGPGDAAFAAIGLDRVVHWHNDLNALAALEHAASEPVSTEELSHRFGADVVQDLVMRNWLQDPDDLCREYFLRTGQIEITAHCNWGCSYCPVAADPKPRETMPLPMFREIVEKLSVYETIRYVTFHFYNEPTLDPLFAERIEVLKEYGTKLELSSNASALTQDKVKILADSGIMHHLVINLPTLVEQEFKEMTGSKTYRQSLRNLEYAIEADSFPIALSVNGDAAEIERNAAMLRDRYEHRGVEVFASNTCDRAGTLEGKYFQGVRVSERLRGCSWPVNHAYFSVRGNMFICPNDYYQREVFGHISDGSVDDIMTSPAALKLRRRVFGVEEAPDDYICRTCHDQKLDFNHRQFRPLATFPVLGTTGSCGQMRAAR